MVEGGRFFAFEFSYFAYFLIHTYAFTYNSKQSPTYLRYNGVIYALFIIEISGSGKTNLNFEAASVALMHMRQKPWHHE